MCQCVHMCGYVCLSVCGVYMFVCVYVVCVCMCIDAVCVCVMCMSLCAHIHVLSDSLAQELPEILVSPFFILSQKHWEDRHVLSHLALDSF